MAMYGRKGYKVEELIFSKFGYKLYNDANALYMYRIMIEEEITNIYKDITAIDMMIIGYNKCIFCQFKYGNSRPSTLEVKKFIKQTLLFKKRNFFDNENMEYIGLFCSKKNGWRPAHDMIDEANKINRDKNIRYRLISDNSNMEEFSSNIHTTVLDYMDVEMNI